MSLHTLLWYTTKGYMCMSQSMGYADSDINESSLSVNNCLLRKQTKAASIKPVLTWDSFHSFITYISPRSCCEYTVHPAVYECLLVCLYPNPLSTNVLSGNKVLWLKMRFGVAKFTITNLVLLHNVNNIILWNYEINVPVIL